MSHENIKSDQNALVSLVEQHTNTLKEAKALWLFGEWRKLAELAQHLSAEDMNIGLIQLFSASAYLQLGEIENAERLIMDAIHNNVDKRLLCTVLIAGVNNSLGRCAALFKNKENIEVFFKKAVDIGISNAELVAHSRAVKELTSLGLLPQATELVNQQLKLAIETPSKIKRLDSHLSILKTELELLTHQLSISQQRMQLYKSSPSSVSHLDSKAPEYRSLLKQLSVSQLGQDLWVLEQSSYKKDGFFVEFGATDGVLLSNTYLLEKEFGWNGICAEPNPKFFEKLQKNRSCIVSNACIAGKSGEQVEFIFADEYGGIKNYSGLDKHSEKRNSFNNIGGTATLITTSLNDFLIKHNAPENIDYISVDTEGSELDILSNFDFNKWNVRAFSVEHNHSKLKEEIRNLLESKGYSCTEIEWEYLFLKSDS